MKISLLIKQERKQFILTPENEYEKNALNDLRDSEEHILYFKTGDFYDCQGGYSRFGIGGTSDFESTIIVIEKKDKKV